ncbi:MAG TPA: cytochrome c oxidase subunit 3 [Acidimicrobiales bacterium]|nr:cytochrome c oxidase subunit 3 [Acidimicrobiales bacterium]
MTQALTVTDAAPGRRHVPERPPLLAVGVMIWLGSELMFFSGLFAAYFTIRAHAVTWPLLAGEHLDTIQAGIFSVVLIASSPTFQMGVWAQERGERRKARTWVVISWLMGTAFVANTLYEWHDFASHGHGPALNAYWSLFYIMSGIRTARDARPHRHDLPPRPDEGTGGGPGRDQRVPGGGLLLALRRLHVGRDLQLSVPAQVRMRTRW